MDSHVKLPLFVRFSIQTNIVANLRAYGVSNEKFNEICHLQSRLVSEWYSKIEPRFATFLAPLALIMESGKLVFAKEIAMSSGIKEFSIGLKSAKNSTLYEHELFGTSSYYVSGLLFEHWNLNEHYIKILKGLDYEHENIEELNQEINILDVVRNAINVKEQFTDDSLANAAEIVDDMGHNVDDFLRVAKNLKKMRNI